MNTTKVDLIFMPAFFEHRQLAAAQLQGVNLGNNVGERFGVARLEKEQAQFTILPCRRRPIREDHGVAENLVAQKGQVELQMLFEFVFEALEIADFLAVENPL